MTGRKNSKSREVGKVFDEMKDVQSEEMSIIKRSQPSVEIKKDAKGIKSFVVKVYRDDPVEAAKEAVKVVKQLEEEFGE